MPSPKYCGICIDGGRLITCNNAGCRTTTCWCTADETQDDSTSDEKDACLVVDFGGDPDSPTLQLDFECLSCHLFRSREREKAARAAGRSYTQPEWLVSWLSLPMTFSASKGTYRD